MAKLPSDEVERVSSSCPGTDPQLAYIGCRPRTSLATVAVVMTVADQ